MAAEGEAASMAAEGAYPGKAAGGCAAWVSCVAWSESASTPPRGERCSKGGTARDGCGVASGAGAEHLCTAAATAACIAATGACIAAKGARGGGGGVAWCRECAAGGASRSRSLRRRLPLPPPLPPPLPLPSLSRLRRLRLGCRHGMGHASLAAKPHSSATTVPAAHPQPGSCGSCGSCSHLGKHQAASLAKRAATPHPTPPPLCSDRRPPPVSFGSAPAALLRPPGAKSSAASPAGSFRPSPNTSAHPDGSSRLAGRT